ncbi:MAG: MBL fold metallo-hydrolase [Verrucomicrobia bacterium]|nr:MBL fold metallo-hydrolase [Verrucomicrobiota bacterium]
MSELTVDLEQASVPSGGVRLFWLGQAGFAFRTAAGKRVFLDPYLSDACERMFGFKRLSLPALAAEEVDADWVVLTHEHADHLDPGALPVIARNNPNCRFAAPSGCTAGLEAAGVTAERCVLLEPNRRHDLGDLVVHTVPADHGDISPSALTLLLEFGGVRVMATGDTSWRPVWFKPLYDLKPDVVLTVINGVFGNMNHIDAARLVSEANPRFAIPCHFWTLAEQGAGDPAGFVNACATMCPEVRAVLLRPGVGLTVEAVKHSA